MKNKKIAHFSPEAFSSLFEKYINDYTFLHNRCDKDVDIIYCGSMSQLSKAMIAKEIFNKPLICWVWDIPYNWREWCRSDNEIQNNQRREAYVKKSILNLRKCDKVISASKYTQRILKKKFNIDSDQIYFYIDTEELDSIHIDSKKGHIIQIGRFAPNKRFDISIRAMKGIDRKFICIGIGRYKKLEELSHKLNVDVDFYCNRENKVKIKLLKESEILVSPSIFEGWGMTPIEALYCKVPVLLNDLEVFKEIYGDNVLYHKKDNVEDMREKLRYLLSDKQLQRKIVERCRPLISEFTVSKFAKRWEKVIE